MFSFSFLSNKAWLSQVYSPLSFTLFPTPIPRSSFQFMMGLQEHVNVLLHRASQDQDFMINALQQ